VTTAVVEWIAEPLIVSTHEMPSFSGDVARDRGDVINSVDAHPGISNSEVGTAEHLTQQTRTLLSYHRCIG